MKIFHYRLDGRHNECGNDDPWGQCMFNSQTNFDDFKIKPLVTIGGQPVISQHEATYITGRDSAHAHHFAKMLAGAILSGTHPHTPSLIVETQKAVQVESHESQLSMAERSQLYPLLASPRCGCPKITLLVPQQFVDEFGDVRDIDFSVAVHVGIPEVKARRVVTQQVINQRGHIVDGQPSVAVHVAGHTLVSAASDTIYLKGDAHSRYFKSINAVFCKSNHILIGRPSGPIAIVLLPAIGNISTPIWKDSHLVSIHSWHHTNAVVYWLSMIWVAH